MSNKMFVLFILCCLLPIVYCEKCQEVKQYNYFSTYGAQIICTDIVDSFPKFTRTVHILKCINCSISTLDENTLSNFKGNTLDLSYSHLNTISSTAVNIFTNKAYTQTLLFNDNEISSIAPKLFLNFKALGQISLRNNNLTELHHEVFENASIKIVDLSGNHIQNVSGLFSDLHVTKLNLSSNNIIEIGEYAFDKTVFSSTALVSGIEVLDLSKNFIEIFKFKQELVNSKLKMLNLTSNKIEKIESNAFSQLRHLTYLSLEANRISELTSNSFGGLYNLTTLILKNNVIKEIPQKIFSSLFLLEDLDLSGNAIHTLDSYIFSGLATLVSLNISHNNLNVFGEGHLGPLGKLVTLDISNNALKKFSLHSIMQHLYRLKLLVLNDNYWSCKDLLQMYKLLNQRIGGFHFPSHHFDVPNLHGIACSRIDTEIYDYKSFDHFLSVISQDQVLDNFYDTKFTNDTDLSPEDVLQIAKTVNKILYVMLIVVFMFVILLVLFTAQFVCNYLSSRSVLSDKKICLKYAQNQDSVSPV